MSNSSVYMVALFKRAESRELVLHDHRWMGLLPRVGDGYRFVGTDEHPQLQGIISERVWAGPSLEITVEVPEETPSYL